MERKEKFTVQDILPLALTIVVAGIGIAYGLNVTADVRDDMTTGTAEWTAANETVAAVGKFSSKLGLIVTVVVAAILIGVLVRYLARP